MTLNYGCGINKLYIYQNQQNSYIKYDGSLKTALKKPLSFDVPDVQYKKKGGKNPLLQEKNN